MKAKMGMGREGGEGWIWGDDLSFGKNAIFTMVDGVNLTL